MDELERLLREQYPQTVEIGSQDPDIGFPRSSPPGFFLSVGSPSRGYVSYIAPTLIECVERALAAQP